MALTQASEEGLKISNAGTNGQFLQKQSGNTGGLTWADIPAGVGGSTGVDFNDSVKARFGTGNDLQIYASGNNSVITHSGDGDLHVEVTGSGEDLYLNANDDVYIRTTTNENAIKCIGDGAVELYHDNSKKLETTSGGAKVTGALEVGGAVNLTDTSTGTGTNGGMYRHSNGWTYYQGKSDGNGAVLSNGDGTATVKAVSPGGSNGYISIESGDGTERARITSGGHVLIGDEGNDNAFFKAHAADGEASDLYVGQFINAEATAGVNYGVNIQGGSNSTDHGLRVKNHAGTSQLLVRGDGEVQIGSGDLVFGTAGKGIVLGSTSNTDANTLSDYEEGTFTPRLGGSNISTYNITGGGSYTKIGRHVYIQIRFNNQDLDNNAADWVRIDGLPFTPHHSGESPTAYGCTRDFNMYKGGFNSGNMYSWNFQHDSTLSGIYTRGQDSWVDWSVGDFHLSNFYMNLNGHYITST